LILIHVSMELWKQLTEASKDRHELNVVGGVCKAWGLRQVGADCPGLY